MQCYYSGKEAPALCLRGRRSACCQVLARAHPELPNEVEPTGDVRGIDLPAKRFSWAKARTVWATYSDGRPHLAASRAGEVAAVAVRKRDTLLAGYTTAAAREQVTSADADATLREVCAALISWGEAGEELGEQPTLSAGAQAMAVYLDADGLAVPRDLGVLPAESLRSLVAAQASAAASGG